MDAGVPVWAKSRLWVLVAILWTLGVWMGRVRNVLSDDATVGGAQLGVLVLCASFLLPTLALAVSVLRPRARGRTSIWLARSLLAWSVGFWLWRMGEMLLGGGRGAAFVMVHAVLGLVSVSSWALAVRALTLWDITDSSGTEACSEEIVPTG